MMSGIRTPPQKPGKTSPKKGEPGVGERRSIGDRIEDWETAKAGTSASPPIRKPPTQSVKTPPQTTTALNPPRLIKNKTIEARECIARAKLHLNKAGNLKREIKEEVLSALTRLLSLIKNIEAELKSVTTESGEKPRTPNQPTSETGTISEAALQVSHVEEHVKLLRENTIMMSDLKEQMANQKELLERLSATTYASITANTPAQSGGTPRFGETLHSVVVTSTDNQDTGEEVLGKIREAVDAKEGWVEVRKVRKAKDRKVIIGLSTEAEREKLKSKLSQVKDHLIVEDIKNRDPLLVLRGVLSVHKDDDILKALKNQNKDLFAGIDKKEDRMEFRYRKRARNPHTCHAVISVSPVIWQRATTRKTVQIDLQPIRVEDQTPLVQCTRCLGYGHSKRYCTGPADLCSHCGGPHLKSECAEFLAGTPPKCKNCEKAGMANQEHNVFDQTCPIRNRWDALARSTVAYC